MRSFTLSNLRRLLSGSDGGNPLRLQHILNVDVDGDALIGGLCGFKPFLKILRRVVGFGDRIFFDMGSFLFGNRIF